MLHSLPLELLHKIGSETPRLEDRKSLRRRCSLFGNAFKAQVLAEVTLNIHSDNLEPGIGLLQALVDDNLKESSQSDSGSGISKYIRALYIDSLSPSFSLESDGNFAERLRKMPNIYFLRQIQTK
ncbi:hypothetical protein BT96DRAFT_916861, partial [Gymnopus androsaceus JB14]